MRSASRQAQLSTSVRAPDSARVSNTAMDQFQVSERVLTIAMTLALWMAAGNLALAITEGLGPHPVRRCVIGILLVASIGTALWKRDALCAVLRGRPWLVVLVAAGQLSAVLADGALNGAYDAVSVTSIGLASIVARARTVWVCVAILDIGYAAGVLADHSVTSVIDSSDLAGALGVLLGYPFAALIVLGLAGLFTRFVCNADATLTVIRDGGLALTPALNEALQLGAGRPIALLPAPSRLADLTAREIEIVEALARGRHPKQIAFDRGISLATVRKHLRLAKRRTGARTLPELAAMTARSDWPGTDTQ